MSPIQNIFRQFGPEYIDRFGQAMPLNHLKAMEAIVDCRTAAFGVAVHDCPECGTTHRFYRSCGNRHCPACQHGKALGWMERRLKKARPGHRFITTFTVSWLFHDIK